MATTPLYRGSTAYAKVMRGATEIERIYKGSTLVFQNDATPSAAWGRVETGIEHFYDFSEDAGTTIADTGGSVAPADLIIPDSNKVSWIGGGGLSVTSSTRIETAAAVANFSNAVIASEAVAMEAWVIPANLTQTGPARIATVSGDPSNRNIMIGQGVYGSTADRIECRINGFAENKIDGALRSPVGSLTTTMTHVVISLNAAGDLEHERLYVNGVEQSYQYMDRPYQWSAGYKLAIGEEFGSTTRSWLGSIYLLALYSRGLTAAEVLQNYNAGPTAP